MPFLVVLILGIVQGLTEFLPVSSSGHLVVAQHYLPGFSGPPLPFDVLLHLGTLVSLTISAVCLSFDSSSARFAMSVKPAPTITDSLKFGGSFRIARTTLMVRAAGSVPPKQTRIFSTFSSAFRLLIDRNSSRRQ